MNAHSLVSPEDQNVTFVELFFDLVFVYSITQIVGILHSGVTWEAAAQALLVFWLVWWAWTQFTWSLNASNTDHPKIQFATLLATAVAFFMAVTVPDAFEGGALWFAVPYVAVRAIGLVVYRWSCVDEAQAAAVNLFTVASLGGLAAVIAGAIVGGSNLYVFWGLAILLDVIAAIGGRAEGWNLHPEHFVERHGLIVIIALGESLIVAASGLTGATTTGALIASGALAVGLTCALWWTYFPYLRPALEHGMKAVTGAARSGMARDAFSLAHFPMLCGVIGMAVGIEETIAHPDHALPLGGSAALGVGLFLFIGGAALARWRVVGASPVLRLLVSAAAAGLIMAPLHLPPWTSLGVATLAAVVVALIEQRAAGRLATRHA